VEGSGYSHTVLSRRNLERMCLVDIKLVKDKDLLQDTDFTLDIEW